MINFGGSLERKCNKKNLFSVANCTDDLEERGLGGFTRIFFSERLEL